MYRKCKVAVSVLLSQIFISPQLLIGKEQFVLFVSLICDLLSQIFISKYLYRYQFLKGDMGASLHHLGGLYM